VAGSLTQTDFRGRNDDGSQTAATFIAAANTNWTQLSGVAFRVRFRVAATVASFTSGYTAYYSRNAGAFTIVSGSSSVVKATSSAFVTDGTATTQQIGTGTFVAGSVDTVDGAFASVTIAGSSNSEFEGCYQIVTADVAAGDTIAIKLEQTGGTLLATYTNIPSITVSVPSTLNISGIYARPRGPNYRR
jgi:hypothetical protein